MNFFQKKIKKNKETDYIKNIFEISLVGDHNIGKTSIFTMYFQKKLLDDDYNEYTSDKIEYKDLKIENEVYHLVVQDKNDIYERCTYKNSNEVNFAIIYSITSRKSFEAAQTYYFKICKKVN
jgi:hypothetical protein